jgi:hypothetical protein
MPMTGPCCKKCRGEGWYTEAACCGNVHDSGGACKGECAVEVALLCTCAEGQEPSEQG